MNQSRHKYVTNQTNLHHCPHSYLTDEIHPRPFSVDGKITLANYFIKTPLPNHNVKFYSLKIAREIADMCGGVVCSTEKYFTVFVYHKSQEIRTYARSIKREFEDVLFDVEDLRDVRELTVVEQ